MSHWKKSENEFAEMYSRLQAQPGLSLRELARELNVSPSTILRRLPGMDEAGYRLYEDDQERLFPFNKD
jgi:Mn-dependent DtxR family transcriptional regulator